MMVMVMIGEVRIRMIDAVMMRDKHAVHHWGFQCHQSIMHIRRNKERDKDTDHRELQQLDTTKHEG